MELLFFITILIAGSVLMGSLAHRGFTLDKILSSLKVAVDNMAQRTSWQALSVTGSIVAFFITTLLMWISFDKTLETTRDIARINLARDLAKEFSTSIDHKSIYKSIVNCEILYDKNGGRYGYEKINAYLGFLDTVAFFYHSGALDYDIVNHHFGGLILEAYTYKEIKSYMEDLRNVAGEEGALEDFEGLAKEVSKDPQRQKQLLKYERDCT